MPNIFASIGRTPYLDCAIACVVSKVQQVVSGETSQQSMLLSYTEALNLLRVAVREPQSHARLDMVAATRLLAIYEMLDFPENVSWMQHVAGAAAMAKLYGSTGLNDCQSAMQAAPMFVEALLNNDESFFESSHWKRLLQVITARQYLGPDLTCETLSCFTLLRSVFADVDFAIRNNFELDWSLRMPLLWRAHELRCRMKSLVLRREHHFVPERKNARSCDVLGLCLVSVMVLDRLIRTLRQANAHRGTDLEEDTQELCTQMVRPELNARPSKELLLAFQRQVNYPLLSYDA